MERDLDDAISLVKKMAPTMKNIVDRASLAWVFSVLVASKKRIAFLESNLPKT